LRWWCRRRITSSLERTSITAFKPWNCSRSRASARATPALSLGNQTIGGGAMSSGAKRILDISSAWSVKGSGGRRGGASGCVRAARSVAVRSSSVSVAKKSADGVWIRIQRRKWTMTAYVVVLVHAVGIAKARPRASWTSSQAQRRTTPLFAPRVLS
jgi:hypothetical protein